MNIPNNRTIPVEYIKECFEYREEIIDGVLQGNVYWKYREDKSNQWNSRCAGKKAGTLTVQGYYRVSIKYNNKQMPMFTHRIVWVLNHGYHPVDMLDHKDINKTNNLISNLRPADSYKNRVNGKKSDKAKSIYTYVTFYDKKWVVSFKKGKSTGKIKTLFWKELDDELDAALLANEMALKFHPAEFINFNDISMGYTNKEYPNKPRGWSEEKVAA